MKDLKVTCDVNVVKVEQDTGSTFECWEIFQPLTLAGPGDEVFVIAGDNRSYVYPATYSESPLIGDVFEGIILANGYEFGDETLHDYKVIGIQCECIDDGGGNNYVVRPIIKDGKPVILNQDEIHRFNGFIGWNAWSSFRYDMERKKKIGKAV